MLKKVYSMFLKFLIWFLSYYFILFIIFFSSGFFSKICFTEVHCNAKKILEFKINYFLKEGGDRFSVYHSNL